MGAGSTHWPRRPGTSEIAQGEGSVLDKAQEAVEGLGEGGGEGGGASGDTPGGSSH